MGHRSIRFEIRASSGDLFKQTAWCFLSFSLTPSAGGRLWWCGQFFCCTCEQTSLIITLVEEYRSVGVFPSLARQAAVPNCIQYSNGTYPRKIVERRRGGILSHLLLISCPSVPRRQAGKVLLFAHFWIRQLVRKSISSQLSLVRQTQV